MNRRPLEEQYKDYMGEVTRQLDNARRQVARISYLEAVTLLSFEQWCDWMGYSVEQTKENQA